MKTELLQLLRCPRSGQRLIADTNTTEGLEIISGSLVTEDNLFRYPIRNGIPRFVPENNYADNFGMQWNVFSKTQLDSCSGLPISSERFWKATGWSSEHLKGEWVLDVGCGAGRFAEVALQTGAQVVALDYSSAVDACYTNLRHYPNLHVVQGDIYALPFAADYFPFVYSLGVLQHTPNVAKAFYSLPPMVKKGGGRLCVDYYEKSWRSAMLPKYWLRPITRRLPKPFILSLLRFSVPVLLPISRMLAGIPVFGSVLRRLVPVANYYGIYDLTDKQQSEWALLDTFDMLAPEYDQPQSAHLIEIWMKHSGMRDIEILRAGHLVARGSR